MSRRIGFWQRRAGEIQSLWDGPWPTIDHKRWARAHPACFILVPFRGAAGIQRPKSNAEQANIQRPTPDAEVKSALRRSAFGVRGSLPPPPPPLARSPAGGGCHRSAYSQTCAQGCRHSHRSRSTATCGTRRSMFGVHSPAPPGNRQPATHSPPPAPRALSPKKEDLIQVNEAVAAVAV
jgi:hypothetical protein